MNISLSFVRIFFVILCTLFMTIYMVARSSGSLVLDSCIGAGIGLGFGFALICLDTLFKRFNLRSFNLATLGLFLGYLMGQVFVLVLNAILALNSEPQLTLHTIEIIKMSLFLTGCYLGMVMTIRSSHEISLSIPFIKFTPLAQKRKDLLIDPSILNDPRIIDVCATGIFDYQLIIPRFLIKDLYVQLESNDETLKLKGRKSLDVIKKLEAIPTLELRFHDTDFFEIKDLGGKLIRLARLLDSNILTADQSRVQTSSLEGIRLINLHSLSNALKPLKQTAEQLKIKIQRIGKEPRQGIGYLDDGTMVVVNGGGDFIGETIDAQVLSVKHTSSGRMIFCNAQDIEMGEFEIEYGNR